MPGRCHGRRGRCVLRVVLPLRGPSEQMRDGQEPSASDLLLRLTGRLVKGCRSGLTVAADARLSGSCSRVCVEDEPVCDGWGCRDQEGHVSAPPCRSWAEQGTSAQPVQKATTAYADQRWFRAGPFASTARTLPTIASGHHTALASAPHHKAAANACSGIGSCAPTGQRDDEQRRQPADRHRVARADRLPGVPEGLTDQPCPDVRRDPGLSPNHLLCSRADEKEAEQVDRGTGQPAVLHHEGGDPSPRLAVQRGRRSLQRREGARHRLLDHEADQGDGGDQSGQPRRPAHPPILGTDGYSRMGGPTTWRP